MRRRALSHEDEATARGVGSCGGGERGCEVDSGRGSILY